MRTGNFAEKGGCRPSLLLVVLAICCIGILTVASSADRVLQATSEVSDYAIVRADHAAPAQTQALYQATNQRQDLTAYFRVSGVTLMPRTAGGSAWELGLDVAASGGATISPDGGQLEYEFSGAPLKMWFANTEAGLQQVVVLGESLRGKGEEDSRVEFALSGGLSPLPYADGQGIEFATSDGTPVLRTSLVQSIDASGQKIPARIEMASGTSFSVVLDTRGASYPVTVEFLAASKGGQDEPIPTVPDVPTRDPQQAHSGKVDGADDKPGSMILSDASPSELGGQTGGPFGLFAPESIAQGIADEVEPNDSILTAQLLSGTNVVVRGNSYKLGNGPGLAPGDGDFYRFQGTVGDIVFAGTMTTFAPSSSTDTLLTLIDPSGATLETDLDDGSFNAGASTIAGRVLNATGTWILRVNQSNTFPGTSRVAPYYLHFRLQTVGNAPTPEPEGAAASGVNDTTGAATALPGNGWVSGTHGTATDQDFYSMTLAAGDSVFIALDGDPERDNVQWNPRLGFGLLGDASNFTLDVDDASTGTATNPLSEGYYFTVKTAGTYYARVYTTAQTTGGATQTYTLNVAVHTATATGTNCMVYSSGTINLPITTPGTTDSTIIVPGNPRIGDLNVSIVLTHLQMADLDVALLSPAGNENSLFTDVGSTAAGAAAQTLMDIDLDDEAALPIVVSANVERPIGWQPEAAYRLAWFKGELGGGSWTLRLRDDTAANGGTLTSWAITICEPPTPAACLGTTVNVMSKDFEADNGGFTPSVPTAAPWQWGTPTAAPIATCNGGTKCWKTNLTGAYSASANQELVSPTMSFSGLGAPISVSWAQKYQLESASFDTFWAEVREAGPTNTTNLFQFLDTTMTDSVGTPSTLINETAGWGLATRDISAYANKAAVQLRWGFVSDSSGQFAGVAIDDVTVTACCTDGPGGSCDDGIPCTTDLCDAALGCTHSNNTLPCSDGNPCTTGDTCGGGSCQPGTNPCDDFDNCTNDICDGAGGCSYTGVVCTDPNPPCATSACVPGIGPGTGCQTTNNNGVACTDGNVCTIGDTCNGGACVPGPAPAPVQFCNSGGAITIPLTLATGSPYPSFTTVSGLPPVLCSVTVDLNGFSHTFPSDLDILLARGAPAATTPNTLLLSDAGGGTTTPPVGGVNLHLDDNAGGGVPTPPATGSWKPTNVGAGDTMPAASPAPSGGSLLSVFNGTNPNGTWNLWVNDQFNLDGGSIAAWCVNISAACVTPADCDDSNDCTDDFCTNGACTHSNNTASCSDGDPCTGPLGVDTCSGGVCVPGLNPCVDGDACTTDTCLPGGGCTNDPINCDDSNVCTTDGCNSTGPNPGCYHDSNMADCSDGNPCTGVGGVDTCSGGSCQPGASNTDQCSDGDLCTVGDTCGGGVCVPGAFGDCPVAQFCDVTGIVIPDSGNATPYPSVVAVAGINYVSRVTVDLNGVSHTFPRDIDALLASPTPAINLIIMSDTGGGTQVPPAGGVNLHLDDAFPAIPDTAPLLAGSYRPTNLAPADTFTGGAPPVSAATALSTFHGINPTGNWNLYVTDDVGGDSGSIANWCLNITHPCTADAECGDGDACTDDSCNVATGLCAHAPHLCNDGNDCTADSCISPTGCFYDPTPLNGTACGDPSDTTCDHADTCFNGGCAPNVAPDGTACGSASDTSCDNPDTCLSGLCATNTEPNGTACDDGDLCTSADQCTGGNCAGQATVAVTPSNLNGWAAISRRTATGAFVAGPPVPPIGTGSYEMSTGPGGAGPALPGGDSAGLGGKTWMSTEQFNGTLLSSITALSYSTFIQATTSNTITVALNVYVDLDGNGTRDTTLVFEPIYTYGNPTPGVWQNWDAYLGGTAKWWYTAAFGALNNPSNDFRPFSDYTTLFPNARILTWYSPGNAIRSDGWGFNFVAGMNGVGAPWNDFIGNIDDLKFATAATSQRYDFDPVNPCDDLDACTIDSCTPGQGCVHTAVNCDDNDACTVDSCNPATGCVYAPRNCDDSNACTNDSCDSVLGCQYVNNTGPCDDGNFCTTSDTCSGGSCQGTAYLPAACVDGNACTDDLCDPAANGGAGACSNPPNTAPCDDGTVCNGHEVCGGGTCNPGTPLDCSDNNDCTDDACHPVSGCFSTPDDTNTCTDGSACTTDSCLGGFCQSAVINCNDGSACTNDSCNPATGCVNAPVNCDDGNACTTDACDPASGCSHVLIDCYDANKCTNDSCNPAMGCVNAPVNCNDGNACTTDACDPASGCSHTSVNCDDGSACTNDSCNPASGCQNTPVVCDDGNACTADACSPASGCSFTTISCFDGNSCTNDSCNPATGCVNGTVTCNDNNPCTDDSCNPGSGCVYTPNNGNACSDGNACTTDSCNAGACIPAPIVCNDGNACSDDTCNPATGCVFTNDNTNSCTDGSACTNDACVGGSCIGTPITCNDGNACTDDSCDPSSGCQSTNDNSNACSDGNACTNDACVSGSCVGTAFTCDDSNPCTDDSCNPGSGCVYTNDDTNTCSDGNACTNDACVGGACQSSASTDTDGDGICCPADNCCTVANPTQSNLDGDALGDACDPCPLDPLNDADGDGVCGNVDNCPTVSNSGQVDTDGDGVGDVCDPCPLDPQNDVDGDGVCGNVDNCPTIANPDQGDNDNDGIGDVCDNCPDSDGDGVSDCDDSCPHSCLDPTVIIPPSCTPPPPPGTAPNTAAPCDSGVPNYLLADGCTIEDKIAACDAASSNKGQFDKCVKALLNQLKKQHIITEAQRKAIDKCIKKYKKRAVFSGPTGGSSSHGAGDH